MFTEIFGNAPRVRLLDFLADHIDYDYTISQLEEFTDITRPTLYGLIGELEAEKMISITRAVGASKFFGLNTQNEKVTRMLQMEFEVINKGLLEQPLPSPVEAPRRFVVPPTKKVARGQPKYTGSLMARRPAGTVVRFKKGRKKSRV